LTTSFEVLMRENMHTDTGSYALVRNEHKINSILLCYISTYSLSSMFTAMFC